MFDTPDSPADFTATPPVRAARRRAGAYAAAAAGVAAAWAARLAVDPLLGTQIPVVFFFLPVLFAAMFGGRGPAAVAGLLGAIGAAYFLSDPHGAVRAGRADLWIGLGTYAVLTAAEVALVESYRLARGRAAALEGEVADGRRAGEVLDRYRLLAEHTRDVVLFVRVKDGSVADANNAAVAAYGYSLAELTARTIYDLRDPDTAATIPAELARADADGVRFETVHRRKDGTRFPVEVSARAADLGGERVVLSIVRDVTDRRLAADALAAQNARLRLLSDTVRHLLTGDRPGDFIPALFREMAAALDLHAYFNYRVADDGGALVLDSYAGAPADVARDIGKLDFGVAVCGCVARDQERRVVEDVQSRADDMTALIRGLGLTAYACHPLTAGGRLLGTLSFGTRSRPRFSDDDLAVMRAVCDHVALAVERADLLARTRRQAEQLAEADRRKDEFLAVLAHELRNPLAPVRNAVHLLRLQGSPDPRAASARDMIDRQVTHLTRLVDDLLDVTRIGRGKIELRPGRVDLRDLLRRSAETARPLMESKRHRLDVDLPAGPVPVDGDVTRLAQVVDNLLTNAGKYTDPGGHVRLSVAAEGGAAVVRVRDDGTGIPPDALPRMFDLFAQAERTLDRAQGGLGIGLALVRRLVELHGGTVTAASDGPGTGSEFTVRLPLGGGPVPHDPGPADPPDTPPGPARLRVLVVDDNEDAAESLAALLHLLGHEVVVAYDGPAGLDAFRTFRPRVAVLDIGLPGLNGFDMARDIRAGTGGDEVTLVALSGYGRDEDLTLSRDAGFDHHLTKPVELARLQTVLTQAVRPTAA